MKVKIKLKILTKKEEDKIKNWHSCTFGARGYFCLNVKEAKLHIFRPITIKFRDKIFWWVYKENT